MVLKVKLNAPDEKEFPKIQPAHVKTDFAEFDAGGRVEGHVVSMDLDLNIQAAEISANQLSQYSSFVTTCWRS